MSDGSLLDCVQALSGHLVLLDPTDLPALAEAHTLVEAIGADAASGGAPRCAQAAAYCGEAIERVILEEEPDPAAALDRVAAVVGAMQTLESRNDAEVAYPEFTGVAPPAQPAPGDAPVPNEPAATTAALGETPYVLPPYVDEAILAEFLSRQDTVLEEMEAAVLAMEHDRDAPEAAELKRIVHTIKGECALLGLAAVEHVCHAAEDAVLTRPGSRLTDDLLALKDWLRRVFDALATRRAVLAAPQSLLDRFEGAATGTEDDADDTVGAVFFSPPSTPAPESAFDATPANGADPAAGAASVPLTGDRELLADFVVEAREHLDHADIHLLRLETEPGDMDAVNAVFRGFHTIKGVAGFIALDGIGGLAHATEELLDHARKGHLELRGGHLDLVFEAVDVMKHAIDDVNRALGGDGLLRPAPALETLAHRIKAALDGGASQAPHGVGHQAAATRLGDILIARGDATEEAINDALDRQRARERDPVGAILRHENVVSAAAMREALHIQQTERPTMPIGEILIAMGAASREDVDAALARQQAGGLDPRLGEILVERGDTTPRAVVSALRAQREEPPQAGGGVAVREAVKVDAHRLDQLVDTIGELVIAETMVTQAPELLSVTSPALRRRVRQLEKISRELQEMATSLRMVPVRPTFQKMARLVRDLAKKTGKPVEFSMSGEETELDKSVVDKIGDPLVHMVRNAVDHGLEDTTEDRVRAGKPPVGNVSLHAYHQGGNILIEIRDDGRGLNRGAILRKAVERGLVPAGEEPDDRAVFNLIFEPGFSTAQKLTEVSGRGVGMDVVKRNIAALRGQVDIESEPGRGSRFLIRLPLTLAIIDGMVVRVGGERFVVPTLSIVLSVRPRAGEIQTAVGRGEMLSLRGQLLPLYRLGRVLDIPEAEDDPERATVMVVESGGRQAGLLIDGILGQQQIVIKPLGQYLRGVPGLSGGAIMPDGNVGLVLDIPGLVKLATQPPGNNGSRAAARGGPGERAHG